MGKLYFHLFLILLLFFSCKNAENKENKSTTTPSRELIPEPDKNPPLTDAEVNAALIAKAHGFGQWKTVKQIHFTMNVDRGDTHFERSWIWKPKQEKVTMITEKDTVSYVRTAIDSTSLGADQAFINDKFWLLAPFNLVWDEGTTFLKEDNVQAPVSKEKLNKLTILYGSEGGYTPGDAYDFFYDTDFVIKEWVFRKGNTPEPSLINTWEAYEDFGGIKISKIRKNAEGSFKLYFTNIQVENE